MKKGTASMRFLRMKSDGYVYAWTETLAKDPRFEEVTGPEKAAKVIHRPAPAVTEKVTGDQSSVTGEETEEKAETTLPETAVPAANDAEPPAGDGTSAIPDVDHMERKELIVVLGALKIPITDRMNTTTLRNKLKKAYANAGK